MLGLLGALRLPLSRFGPITLIALDHPHGLGVSAHGLHGLALDRVTGAVVWDATLEDYSIGYSATIAPIVVKDKVVVGVAGGEYGIRGFIDAYDTETGIRTTAVVLGRRASLALCFALWTGLAAFTLRLGSGNPLSLLPLTYPMVAAGLLVLDRAVDSVYWFYPYINTCFGCLLFLSKAVVTPWG